jgi:hypothetical protein
VNVGLRTNLVGNPAHAERIKELASHLPERNTPKIDKAPAGKAAKRQNRKQTAKVGSADNE